MRRMLCPSSSRLVPGTRFVYLRMDDQAEWPEWPSDRLHTKVVTRHSTNPAGVVTFRRRVTSMSWPTTLSLRIVIYEPTLSLCIRHLLNGSVVSHMNEVAIHRARLVLGWVTVFRFNSRCGKIYFSVNVTSHPGKLNLAIPPSVDIVSTRQGRWCLAAKGKLMGLGKPKLCTKFEMASFSRLLNIEGKPQILGSSLSPGPRSPYLMHVNIWWTLANLCWAWNLKSLAQPLQTYCREPKFSGSYRNARPPSLFPLGVILWWALTNPSYVPNSKSLASAVAEILQGRLRISRSSRTPGPHPICLLVGSDDGL